MKKKSINLRLAFKKDYACVPDYIRIKNVKTSGKFNSKKNFKQVLLEFSNAI